jgi:hypothetical protein
MADQAESNSLKIEFVSLVLAHSASKRQFRTVNSIGFDLRMPSVK